MSNSYLRRACGLLLTGLFSVSSAANAQTVSCPTGGNAAYNASMEFAVDDEGTSPRVVFAVGKIERGTADRLKKVMQEAGRIDEVWLHSPGGNAEEGLKLGRLLREAGMFTRIPPGASCFSACSYAFLGGVLRAVDSGACYGVHMFSLAETRRQIVELLKEKLSPSEDAGPVTREEVNEMIEEIREPLAEIERQAATLMRERARFLLDMSISVEILTRVTYTKNDDFYWMVPEEMRELNIVNIE